MVILALIAILAGLPFVFDRTRPAAIYLASRFMWWFMRHVAFRVASEIADLHRRLAARFGLGRVILCYAALVILLPFVVGRHGSTHHPPYPQSVTTQTPANIRADVYAEELSFKAAQKLEHRWYTGEPPFQVWQDLDTAIRSGVLVSEKGNLDHSSCFRLAEGIGKNDKAHQACYRTASPHVWQCIQELSGRVAKQGINPGRYRIESLTRTVAYTALLGQGSPKSSHNWGTAFDIDLNQTGLSSDELEALHRSLYEMEYRGEIAYYMEADNASGGFIRADYPVPFDLSKGGQMHVVVAPVSFGLGRGSWIYALDRLELARVSKKLGKDARRQEQIRMIVAKAKANRLNYLIVRTSHHGTPVTTCPDDLAAMLRDACHAQGIQVWGYGRISATDVEAEVECAKKVLRPARNGGLDFDGYIYDAEGEKGETRGQDRNVEAILSTVHSWLKATVPDKRLAYSTYGIIHYHNFHSWFPRDLYDKYCHYAMPQLYWVSWRQGKLNWSLEESVRQSNAEWKDCPIPVIPTVQSYASVKPAEMTEFLSGLDTSLGFNAFRWELTGKKQWSGISVFRCADRASTEAEAKPAKMPRAKGKPSKSPGLPGKATPPPIPLPGSAPSGPLKGLAVILDPGHGGMDGGTPWTSPQGVPFCEATISYMMAWELAEMLQEKGATVYLSSYSRVCLTRQTAAQQLLWKPTDAVFLSDGTRTNSNNSGLRSRLAATSLPKGFPRDRIYWISLHADSTAGHLKGVHILRRLSGSNPLANAIGREMTENGLAWNHPELSVVGTTTRRSKHRKGLQRIHVLDANPLVNVALVECGFPKADGGDSWRLRSPSHRNRILEAIAAAIEDTYQP